MRLCRACFCLMILFGLAGGAPGQGYSPEEAPRRMAIPAELEVQLFASEPMVRQPVAMTFDDRGRLWVIQYLQYPNPAGLKRIKVDRYSRTVYDRVPEPPPLGPRGADRITILEDRDGDGRADESHDFVTGLNLATGLVHGYGGVFVAQAPYLLFYPDRDRNDQPDNDPEVLLSGFGIEDAHSVVNSLAWGPDGWLYGAQGSTVTADIRGISFQQGIWRYHPITREFELFAEGGGHTWGLDFDRHGNLLAGTNVGGYAILHPSQGGYYWKSFGKHGELHNPYAYGYLEHIPYADFRGGHVTCGGIVYQGTSLPERFHNRYIAANLLSHAVYWHELEPNGSTFRAHHGGDFLVANDTWFAPVDLTVAPDGAVLVADWHDRRTAHPDPDADWDRSNGRIYRVQAKGVKPSPQVDLNKLSLPELFRLLSSPSGWHRTTSRRILVERRETTILEDLHSALASDKTDATLNYLWTLHGLDGLDEPLARKLLSHENEYVRLWTIRFLGDKRRVPAALVEPLRELAQQDASPAVRAQLASAAARIPTEQALPILMRLVEHDEDASDLQIPLLIWWAIERHLDGPGVLEQFSAADLWRRGLVREHLTQRIARRLADRGESDDLAAAALLLSQLTDESDRALVIDGLNAGFRGKGIKQPSAELAETVRQRWSAGGPPLNLIELAMTLGLSGAKRLAAARAVDRSHNSDERARLIEILGQSGDGSMSGPFLRIVNDDSETNSIRAAALSALARIDEAAIFDHLLESYAKLPVELRGRVITVLAGRQASAKALLRAVECHQVPSSDLTVDHLRRIAALHDSALDAAIVKTWGRLRDATPEEKLADVRRLNNDLRAATGDATAGRALFLKHCGTCHRLFGEGNQVGPDLTTANRSDRDFLLVSIVDPSAQVRKEYLSYNLQTRDGRVLTGIVTEDESGQITIVDAKNERTSIARDEVQQIEPASQSLMPERIWEKVSPQELRDLFSYLQATQPPAH